MPQIDEWWKEDHPVTQAMAGDAPAEGDSGPPVDEWWKEDSPVTSQGQAVSEIGRAKGVQKATEYLGYAFAPQFQAGVEGSARDLLALGAHAVGTVVPGATAYGDQLNRESDYLDQAAHNIAAEKTNYPIVADAFRGTVRTLPTMARAVQLGGPYGAIGLASATEYSHALTEGKDSGLTGAKLHAYAGAHAAVEGGIETAAQALGMGGVKSQLAEPIKEGVFQALKQAGKHTLEEIPQELLTELGHNAVRQVAGIDPNALSRDSIAQTAATTTLQSLMTGGAAGTPGVVHAAIQQRQQAQQPASPPQTAATDPALQANIDAIQQQYEAEAPQRAAAKSRNRQINEEIKRQRRMDDRQNAAPPDTDTVSPSPDPGHAAEPEETGSVPTERIRQLSDSELGHRLAGLDHALDTIDPEHPQYDQIDIERQLVNAEIQKRLGRDVFSRPKGDTVSPTSAGTLKKPAENLNVPADVKGGAITNDSEQPQKQITDDSAAIQPTPIKGLDKAPQAIQDAISSLPQWMRDRTGGLEVAPGRFPIESEGEGTRYDQSKHAVLYEQGDLEPDAVDHAAHETTVAYLVKNDHQIRPFVSRWGELRYAHMPDLARKVAQYGSTAYQGTVDTLASEIRLRLLGKSVSFGDNDSTASQRDALIDQFLATQGGTNAQDVRSNPGQTGEPGNEPGGSQIARSPNLQQPAPAEPGGPAQRPAGPEETPDGRSEAIPAEEAARPEEGVATPADSDTVSASVPREHVVTFEKLGLTPRKSGKPYPTPIIKNLATDVAEFRYNPVLVVDNRGMLVFKDGMKFSFPPEQFGLGEQRVGVDSQGKNTYEKQVQPGDRVRVDLASLGIKPATEADVVSQAMKDQGFANVKVAANGGKVTVSYRGLKIEVVQHGPENWSSPSHQHLTGDLKTGVERANDTLKRIRWSQPGDPNAGPSKGREGPVIGTGVVADSPPISRQPRGPASWMEAFTVPTHGTDEERIAQARKSTPHPVVVAVEKRDVNDLQIYSFSEKDRQKSGTYPSLGPAELQQVYYKLQREGVGLVIAGYSGEPAAKKRIGQKKESDAAAEPPVADTVSLKAKPTGKRRIGKKQGGSVEAYQGQTAAGPASPGGPRIPTDMDTLSLTAPVTAQEVVATVSKLFDLPIRSGRVAQKRALGIYKNEPEVVRTKGQNSADLAVVSHELAHHLDKTTDAVSSPEVTDDMKSELRKLDYEPQKARLNEGFAEFLRTYMTHDAAAARSTAPQYYDHFVNTWLPKNAGVSGKLDQVKAMIDRWRKQGASARVDSAISETGVAPGPVQTMPEKLRDFATAAWKQTLRTAFDETQVLKDADAFLKEKGGVTPGDPPLTDLYAVLSRGWPGMAERAIEDGVYTIDGTRVGDSLSAAMKDIAENEATDFRRFLYVRHALEVYAKRPGMNPGISEQDARFVYDEFAGDGEKFDRFTKAATAVTDYSRSLLEVLTRAGVITPESAAAMREAWQTYVPLSRAMEPKKRLGKLGPQAGLLNIASPVMRRKGSGRQVIDPIAALYKQTQMFYSVAARKHVEQEFVRHFDPQLGGIQGAGGWLERVPANRLPTRVNLAEVWPAIAKSMEESGVAEDLGFDEEVVKEMGDGFAEDFVNIWRPDYRSSPTEHISRVVIDGKPVLYQWNPDLYEAVKGQAPVQLPWFARFMAMGVSALKLGATELNPAFAGANIVRDWWTNQHQSQFQGPLEAMLRPFGEIVTFSMSELAERGLLRGQPDAMVKLWKQAGGKLATRYGMDRAGIENMRRHAMGLSRNRTLRENLILPIETAREVINVSEVGPRLAEFVAALRDSGYERGDGKIVESATGQEVDAVPLPALVRAMRASQEVTVDFGRRGAYGKWADKFVPFLNAALQGSYGLGRVLGRAGSGLAKLGRKEDLDRGEKRVLIALASAGAATVAYWMIRGDDDDYQEEENWLKHGYWTFTDSEGKPIVRVPRGYEYSFVPSLTEAVLNSVKQGSLKPLRAAMWHETRNRIPLNGPAVITPALEAWSNYDMFRERRIENQHLQRLRPGDRANPYTTSLMKAIGQWLNLSPARLEHFVDSVTGGGYRRLYGTAERLAEGRPEPSDVPFAGSFVIRKDYAESVDRFYQEKDKLEQEYNSARDKGAVPDDLYDRFHRFSEYAELATELRKPLADEHDRDKRFEVERYLVGLSRFALGKDELERYPNPLKADPNSMPESVAKTIKGYQRRLAERRTLAPPKRRLGESVDAFQRRRQQWQSLRRRSTAGSK